jgi:uncharacterized NAD(P)/FAD-binding protein YdhS
LGALASRQDAEYSVEDVLKTVWAGDGKLVRNLTYSVVVVGGGFSGTMLAANLLRRARSLSVAVIDKGPLPGPGLAYGTKYDSHVLNVPAGNMSALPEEPDHFLRWARANYRPSVQAASFLPRPLYGRYVSSLLEDAAAPGSAENFRVIQGEATSFARERSHVTVQLKAGSRLVAKAVVLAAGNFPPANLNIPGLSEESERYVPSPWSAAALDDIPKTGSVLLIGSGLTSVDVAVALKTEGFAGHIHILSRRGLMPRIHRATSRWPQFWNEQSPRTTRGLLRLVRAQVRAASEGYGDWREVIDALRPVTQKIWKSLPLSERKRFLRHVRPFWEVHRHRIAPEIGDRITHLVHSGKATVHAGRLTAYREFSHHVEVDWRDRQTQCQRLLRVDRVINCTGPETDCRQIDDPLIKGLLAQGFARPDRLFLGLDVDSNGALVDFAGTPSPFLYALGPIRKGSLWESIAVPELRLQASQLAEHLVGRLLPHPPKIHRVAPQTAGLALANIAATRAASNEEPVS